MSDWLDNLSDQLEEKLSEQEDPVKSIGKAGLEALKENKDNLTHLGHSSFSLLLSNLAIDDKEAAVLIYIRSKALAQELIDGMNEDSIDLIKAKEEYEAIKAEALKILVDIGSAAAKVLFPMVLALI